MEILLEGALVPEYLLAYFLIKFTLLENVVKVLVLLSLSECLSLETGQVSGQLLVTDLVHLLCILVDLSVLPVEVLGVEEDQQAIKLQLLWAIKVRLSAPLENGEAHWVLDLAEILLALSSVELLTFKPELVLVVAVLVLTLEVCDQLGDEPESLVSPAALAGVLQVRATLGELVLGLLVEEQQVTFGVAPSRAGRAANHLI